jgi:HEAT repeat protein
MLKAVRRAFWGSPSRTGLTSLTLAFVAATLFAAEKPTDPTQLISQLTSGDVAARRNASYELSQLGPKAKDAVPALIKALDDNDKQVWTNAIATIAALGPDAKDAVPALLSDLNSQSASRQRSYYRDQVLIRTSYALTRIGPVAIPPLIEGLQSKDTMMRSGAARALGGMGADAKDAIPALVENLGHWDTGVQTDAIDALGSIGGAAKPKVVEALAGKEPRQRSAAALALGAIGKPAQDAATPMLAQLKSETDVTVRASLLSALPRLGADPAKVVPALIDGMKDEREPIRHAAINGLLTMRAAQPQIVKALAGMLRDPNAAASERAAYVLGRLGETAGSAAPAILSVIATQATPSQACLDALVQIGEPAVTPMLAAFEKEKPANLTRDHWVVKCLQQMGGLGAAPIARNLTHPSGSVRLLAVLALVELGLDAEAAIPALFKALDDEDPHVRAAALIALVGARAPLDQLQSHLDKAFKDPSPIIRAAAVEAAVRLGDEGKDFRPRVISALKDPDETVRKAVTTHLGAAFADALPQLTALLDDRSQRSGAIEALGRIGPASKPAVAPLVKLLGSSSKDDRLRILTSLGQIGASASEALPAIAEARKDSDAAIRIAAYQATAAVESKKSERVAALLPGLDDSDLAVRQAVAETLGKLGDQAADAFTKLVALAGADSDRAFALVALGQIGVRDIPKLVSLLQDPHREVRLYAIYRLDTLARRAKDALPALEPILRDADPEIARAARKAVGAIRDK